MKNIMIMMGAGLTMMGSVGCSVFGEESYYHQQQVAYSKAQDGRDLMINPPLTTSKMSDAYLIPQADKAQVSVDVPPPPGSSLDPETHTS